MATRVLRPIRIEGNIAYVPLTKGYEALIDATDIDLVSPFCWHVREKPTGLVHAVRTVTKDGRRAAIFLHHAIMPSHEGRAVDHINGNGLDNRRANLRLATTAENLRNRGANRNNTSGRKGVSWDASRKKWLATIRVDGVQINLGRHASLSSAADAYDAAARKYHGTFARTNA